MQNVQRPDQREFNQLRPVSYQLDIAPAAAGSVLIRFGNTQVICAASLEADVPKWMLREGQTGGWMTAEYSMLPYSTDGRKQRDSTRGKVDGRTIEIQRLIGRSLRAVTDLSKLPGHTLWFDCDVLQADGGTRTASITGAYIAGQIAVQRAMAAGRLAENPFSDSVAAISVGIWEDQEILDLCYLEDRDASVDANMVMTGSARFVETQISGEEATYDGAQLNKLLELAKLGIEELTGLQQTAIKEALASPSNY
ncbi:MAG: ribonuclease PH [Puniceicoccaceae bacterium 5H]|nr:MAG: ribonuclease PH [Puniceicoccaceae bacterium 5H]